MVKSTALKCKTSLAFDPHANMLSRLWSSLLHLSAYVFVWQFVEKRGKCCNGWFLGKKKKKSQGKDVSAYDTLWQLHYRNHMAPFKPEVIQKQIFCPNVTQIWFTFRHFSNQTWAAFVCGARLDRYMTCAHMTCDTVHMAFPQCACTHHCHCHRWQGIWSSYWERN